MGLGVNLKMWMAQKAGGCREGVVGTGSQGTLQTHQAFQNRDWKGKDFVGLVPTAHRGKN